MSRLKTLSAKNRPEPPPADALPRLQQRLRQLQESPPETFPAGLGNRSAGKAQRQKRGRKPGKMRKGGKPAIVPIRRHAKAVPKKKHAEVWVPAGQAGQLKALAKAYQLPAGLLLQQLAEGTIRVIQPVTGVVSEQRPWHVRWTLPEDKYAGLESTANAQGISVGTLCLRQAWRVLTGEVAPKASVLLLLPQSERTLLADLQHIISACVVHFELRGETGNFLGQLRQAAQRIAAGGSLKSDAHNVNTLLSLIKTVSLRAKYGADLTAVRKTIAAVAASFPGGTP